MTRIMCSGACHREGMGWMTRNLFLTGCGLKDKSTFPMQNTEIKVFPAGFAGQGQPIPFQTSFRTIQFGAARHRLCMCPPCGLHSSPVWLQDELCDASSPSTLCPLCIKCSSSAGLRDFLWQFSTGGDLC